jgi:hypothetical protein
MWRRQVSMSEVPGIRRSRTAATSPGSLSGRLVDPHERRHLIAWLLGRVNQPERLHITGWQDRLAYYHR